MDRFIISVFNAKPTFNNILVISWMSVLLVEETGRIYCARSWAELLSNQTNKLYLLLFRKEPSWSCSYGSWISNYLCNQCLSPLQS
jgi:hypothetical protein